MENWRDKLPTISFVSLCVLLIVVGFVQIGIGVGNLTNNHVKKADATQTAVVPALGFYSATLPSSAQNFINDWFTRHDITTNADNFSVHANTYQEKLYKIDQSEFRDITFIADSKSPKVSYNVYVQVNLNPATAEDSETMTYITCPSDDKQFGDKNNCSGMDQL